MKEQELNPAQREAVTHGCGPLLVLAGAGSGKTRVLTYRIAHLLAEGSARPGEITAVTFTNRAAREMRERVEHLLGGAGHAAGVFLGTFHRWALEILRRYPDAAGLPPRFSILDTDDQRALVKRVMTDLGVDAKADPPQALLARISAAVNTGLSPSSLESGGDPGREMLAAVWRAYRDEKRRVGAVDFDDMLALALEVVREHEPVRSAVARRARWLLVDEFQDTNKLQMWLLKAVVDGDRNITAVGDEDQSIYRWRGAEIDNILTFEQHFPGARVVALEENYRSTQPILDAAGELIRQNTFRRGKRLYTSRSGGDPVRLYVGEDERAEARWVVDRIQELEGTFSLGSLAVLMRTNAQTRPFEEELTRRQLSYRVVGGLRFWQRAEVRDAVAYLRLLGNPADTLAFRRVVNVPARGIGAATMDVLERHAAATGLPLPVAAAGLPGDLTPRARQALESFFELLEEGRRLRGELAAGDLVGWLLEESGLLSLYDGDDPGKLARRENLEQLAAAVADADLHGQTLEELMDSIALLEEGDEVDTGDSVSLMTLHAAKGLEIDAVFLVGLEEGLLPHGSSRDDPQALEEERRLAYVGMTRARRWLALAAARSRFLFGQRQATSPSRFLAELPATTYQDVSDLPVTLGRPEAAIRSDRPTMATGGVRARGHVPPVPSSRRPRPVRATVTDTAGNGWRPGDRVRHRRFGSGVILSCQGRGPQLKLVVYFDRAGRKTLVPTIAKLEKM
ncbi:MAG: UvrD-helicase domain-containing protein [Acidobacteria bacterium]|nr:UvrD-helicase domain-containing protein [Acidobacteriota bacterium]